jgi:tRNA pseudouridine55 synthase
LDISKGAILLLNKPQGWTSFDCVAKIRGIFRIKKVGHAGTLDPMATGVLPICIGRPATRHVDIIAAGSKQYLARILFGVETTTQDITGTIIKKDNKVITKAELDAVLPNFIGDISQIPPMYSAIKKNGKKLYELAREGVEIEREPRKINISEIKILKVSENYADVLVSCSKGTYIRTLAHDIGESLGTCACLAALCRTKVAAFTIDKCQSMQSVIDGSARLIPIDTFNK